MISIKPSHERRRDPRLDNNIPVKICQENGDVVAETQNISRSGAYCRTEEQIALMTKLKVHLLFPSMEKGKKSARKISCEGVVVRSEPVQGGEGYHIAIFFSDITNRDMEFITDYVETYLKKTDNN